MKIKATDDVFADRRSPFERIMSWFKWNVWRHIQRFFTGYSYDMKWNAFYHMSVKIYPILKDYAESEHVGAPTPTILSREHNSVVDKFGLDRVTAYEKAYMQNDEEIEEYLFKRWDEIVQQILFAVKHIAVDNEERPEYCYDPNPHYDPKQTDPFYFVDTEDGKYRELKFNKDYGKTNLNHERAREFDERVATGFELLGAYWRNLWD